MRLAYSDSNFLGDLDRHTVVYGDAAYSSTEGEYTWSEFSDGTVVGVCWWEWEREWGCE